MRPLEEMRLPLGEEGSESTDFHLRLPSNAFSKRRLRSSEARRIFALRLDRALGPLTPVDRLSACHIANVVYRFLPTSRLRHVIQTAAESQGKKRDAAYLGG